MAPSSTDWSRKHDPFNKLSPEILEMIFAQILIVQIYADATEDGSESTSDARLTLPLYLAGRLPLINLYNAAIASPILSQQLAHSRSKIVFDVIRKQLPQPILQSAVAVLTFPDPQMGGLRCAVDEKKKDQTWNTEKYPD